MRSELYHTTGTRGICNRSASALRTHAVCTKAYRCCKSVSTALTSATAAECCITCTEMTKRHLARLTTLMSRKGVCAYKALYNSLCVRACVRAFVRTCVLSCVIKICNYTKKYLRYFKGKLWTSHLSKQTICHCHDHIMTKFVPFCKIIRSCRLKCTKCIFFSIYIDM